MKIIINGQDVTRDIELPTKEEATRVTDVIKKEYGLNLMGIAAMFGMSPNPGGATNVKRWRNGKSPMPLSHYFLALEIIGEFEVEIVKIKVTDK